MGRADEAVEPQAAPLADFRRFENAGNGRRGQHVAAEHGKITQPKRHSLFDRNGGRRRCCFETDGEENDLPVRIILRQRHGISTRINHADIGALRFRLEQGKAIRSRHAQAVAVGAQGDALLQRQPDRLIDAADRQHANRAAGAVDHFYVIRQQIGHAIAGNGVRMAAAEFHEMVAAPGLRLAPDGDGEFLRDLAIAEFIDVFHQ